jgi:hypothetical protein
LIEPPLRVSLQVEGLDVFPSRSVAVAREPICRPVVC